VLSPIFTNRFTREFTRMEMTIKGLFDVIYGENLNLLMFYGAS
jgi:hypothetical protein